jgi:hypothetical protein
MATIHHLHGWGPFGGSSFLAYAALLWRKIETLPLTKRVSSTLRHHMGNAGAGVPWGGEEAVDSKGISG